MGLQWVDRTRDDVLAGAVSKVDPMAVKWGEEVLRNAHDGSLSLFKLYSWCQALLWKARLAQLVASTRNAALLAELIE